MLEPDPDVLRRFLPPGADPTGNTPPLAELPDIMRSFDLGLRDALRDLSPEQRRRELLRFASDFYLTLDRLARPIDPATGRPDQRGSPETVLGNQRIARICRDMFVQELGEAVARQIEHVGGSFSDGGDDYLREFTIPTPGGLAQFRRGDIAWRIRDILIVLNTATVDARGNLVPREDAALRDMNNRANVRIDEASMRVLAHAANKLPIGANENDLRDYENYAREVCRELTRRLAPMLAEQGLGPALRNSAELRARLFTPRLPGNDR